ncbi:MAG: SDR family oxidoreductase [Solirubrobacterales bacterium]|nr:SDR family oxidoreductase [Solirubrobacterales bacterium]
MDLGIEGRVALVTGGSRGIGLGIARALAAEGARVAVAARTRESVEQAAAGLRGRGYVFDAEDLGAVGPLVDSVERDLGPVELYVANTGGPPPGDPLAFAVEQWEAAHRSLVISPMLLAQRLLPGMRDRGFGRVVAVSSSAAREPLAHLQLTNANRPGLLAALKLLARQAAGDGVTINAILPGRIATEHLVEAYDDLEDAQRAARDDVPAGRLGAVEEIAAVAAFLCSAPASYVTGTSVLVDGGLTRSW